MLVGREAGSGTRDGFESIVGVEDACLLLGVSRSIFYKLIHRADFPAFKVGGRMLVNVDGLRRWVDAQTEQAQTEREGVSL